MKAYRSGRIFRRAACAGLALLGSVAALADSGPQATAENAQRVEANVAAAPGGTTTGSFSAHRDRTRHGSTRGHIRPRTRQGLYFGWGPYWGATWGGYWTGYWDPYWYGPRPGYTVVYPRAGERYGALDTDISPERAEVWVDGRKVGVADEFDGFPSYLWLEEGTYDVVFYRPGFKTLARQYSIYPGLVIDVEDRLERGEAVHPLDLGPETHTRRDERLRREEERRRRLEQDDRGREAEGLGAPGRGEWLDVRGEPGRLRLRVSPADASIYLDGRFVGTGGDLERLRAGLLVDSGHHTLEIVRPGYQGERREVEVTQGEETELSVDLEGGPAERP